MKSISLPLALSLLLLLTACRTVPPPAAPGTFSGIPQAISTDAWLPGTNSVYHLPPHPDSGDFFGAFFDGSETTKRRIVVSCPAAQRGDLLTLCRGGVMKLLAGAGANIRGGSNLSDRDGLRDFSENYQWQDHQGTIQVFGVATGKKTVTLIIFCNEHKRLPEPAGK
jgi:hypothetical protein